MIFSMKANNPQNINGNNPKKFHVWDFPDTLFLLFSPEGNEYFFSKMYYAFGSQKSFAEYLGKWRQEVNKYHKQSQLNKGQRYPVYFPLNLFKKCVRFFDMERLHYLESNISEIRANVGLSIYSPKLPIIENSALYRIIAHILADGFAGKGKTPYYANMSSTLRNQFKKDLEIFGKMKIYERIPNTTPIVCFPKTVSDILAHLFDVQFTHPNRVPESIFSASSKCRSSFLRAIFDDEGSISVGLTVTIHNYVIMRQIKRLLTMFDIKSSKVMIHINIEQTDKIYLQVLRKSFESFRKHIGFNHPEKAAKLNFAIKTKGRKTRTRHPLYFEQRILEILETSPSHTIDIANELLLTYTGLMPHLERMLDEGLLVKRGYSNRVLWDLA